MENILTLLSLGRKINIIVDWIKYFTKISSVEQPKVEPHLKNENADDWKSHQI